MIFRLLVSTFLYNQQSVDSISGPKALMIIPRLVDAQGNKIEFSNAALETVLEVSSGGA